MLSSEYLVIGSGQTGIFVTEELAKAGKKVILIEQDIVGGSFVNEVDMPRSILMKKSQIFSKLLSSTAKNKKILTELVKKRKEISSDITKEIRILQKELLKKLEDYSNVKIIKGQAEFSSHSLIEVNSEEERHLIGFKTCILAVGKNLEEVRINAKIDKKVKLLSREEVYTLIKIPKTLTIIGLTIETIEIAHIYSNLGVVVDIYEEEDKHVCLSNIDRTAVNYTLKQLLRKQVNIHFGWKVASIKYSKNSNTIESENGEKVKVSDIFVPTFRGLDSKYLGLEKIGAKFNKTGIKANNYGAVKCKSKKRIIALGECVDNNIESKKDTINNFLINQKVFENDKSGVFQSSLLNNITTKIIKINSKNPVSTIGLSEKEAISKYGSQVKQKVIYNYNMSGFCKLIYKDSNKELIGSVLAGDFSDSLTPVLLQSVQNKSNLLEISYYIESILDI